MNPVAIIRGALEAIKAEDETHRDIMFNAVRSELDAIQGGCPCERLAGRDGKAVSVVTNIFHGTGVPFAQVKKQEDSGTMCGQGKTVADAMRDLHE